MRYWPRRAGGLPPGQRLMTEMPRFTDLPHLPPPEMSSEPRLEISNEGETIAVLTGEDIEALKPTDHLADFHCVTTLEVPYRMLIGPTAALAERSLRRGRVSKKQD